MEPREDAVAGTSAGKKGSDVAETKMKNPATVTRHMTSIDERPTTLRIVSQFELRVIFAR